MFLFSSLYLAPCFLTAHTTVFGFFGFFVFRFPFFCSYHIYFAHFFFLRPSQYSAAQEQKKKKKW